MSRANPRFRRVSPSLPLIGTTNGFVSFAVQGSLEGQLTINTFTYAAANPAPTQAQLLALLASIDGNLATVYKAAVSADWTWTRTLLTVLHRNDIARIVSTTRSGQVGTGPAGHEPTEVAAVILRTSAVKGQHGRGRIGIPAVPTSWVTSSTVTLAAGITALNNLATAMLTTASDGANTWTPSIGQRSTASPKLIVGFAALASTQTTVLLGTIRRRKIGRGK